MNRREMIKAGIAVCLGAPVVQATTQTQYAIGCDLAGGSSVSVYSVWNLRDKTFTIYDAAGRILSSTVLDSDCNETVVARLKS